MLDVGALCWRNLGLKSLSQRTEKLLYTPVSVTRGETQTNKKSEAEVMVSSKKGLEDGSDQQLEQRDQQLNK